MARQRAADSGQRAARTSPRPPVDQLTTGQVSSCPVTAPSTPRHASTTHGHVRKEALHISRNLLPQLPQLPGFPAPRLPSFSIIFTPSPIPSTALPQTPPPLWLSCLQYGRARRTRERTCPLLNMFQTHHHHHHHQPSRTFPLLLPRLCSRSTHMTLGFPRTAWTMSLSMGLKPRF